MSNPDELLVDFACAALTGLLAADTGEESKYLPVYEDPHGRETFWPQSFPDKDGLPDPTQPPIKHMLLHSAENRVAQAAWAYAKAMVDRMKPEF